MTHQTEVGMLARAAASSALLRLEEIAVAAGASTTTSNAARRTTASQDGRDHWGCASSTCPAGARPATPRAVAAIHVLEVLPTPAGGPRPDDALATLCAEMSIIERIAFIFLTSVIRWVCRWLHPAAKTNGSPRSNDRDRQGDPTLGRGPVQALSARSRPVGTASGQLHQWRSRPEKGVSR